MQEEQPRNEFYAIGNRVREGIEKLDRYSPTSEIVTMTGLLCVTEALGLTEVAAECIVGTTTRTERSVGKKVSNLTSSVVNRARGIIMELPRPPKIKS